MLLLIIFVFLVLLFFILVFILVVFVLAVLAVILIFVLLVFKHRGHPAFVIILYGGGGNIPVLRIFIHQMWITHLKN